MCVGGGGGGGTLCKCRSCLRRCRLAFCLHSIVLMNEWILAKLAQIYRWVGENADSILTLTPFSRSHEGLDCW